MAYGTEYAEEYLSRPVLYEHLALNYVLLILEFFE